MSTLLVIYPTLIERRVYFSLPDLCIACLGITDTAAKMKYVPRNVFHLGRGEDESYCPPRVERFVYGVVRKVTPNRRFNLQQVHQRVKKKKL